MFTIADTAGVANPIAPLAAGDIGERLILAPQAISPHVEDDLIRARIAALSSQYNTVVLVPSKKAMDRWPTADRRAFAASAGGENNIQDVVKELKSGSHVGLVLLANKYDGIDLPQDACRILVTDGLPESFSGEERLGSLLTSYEAGVDLMQVQRIEQGMARGVHSNEDHCVVILLGHLLAQLTVDPRTFGLFSPATQAQLQASKEVANSLSNRSLTEILDTARQVLNRDQSWVTFAKRALNGVVEPRPVLDAATTRRKAFEAAVFGDLKTSVDLLREAAQTCDAKTKGWLLEQTATYLDQTNPSRAQDVWSKLED
ncbi:hypothetical protein [Paenarthrobacter ilicis]|uniref:Uncharacterized protein n=1 Tax=Paenarthrobacter ilicis TaxID=43665 RepID=A0ABX0TMT5_9MICC|nr:hypothetical protein [Paenarthrobacter ilicis]MBM7793048.1 hypothetical protein [Paenarthrobacter ilicis]NIJ03474.1 hypothetical protein [Paenarthrobacter ilicis]